MNNTFLIVVCFLGSMLNGCSQERPSIAEGDVIDIYEKMREQTGQEHSHVEYCENDIVKLKISSRGRLSSRHIFAPRKSVTHLRNRDALNTYPLGVKVAVNCLSMEAINDCQENSKVVGINVSLLDTTQRLISGRLEHDMEPADFKFENLYVLKKHERFSEMDHMNKDDLVYTNLAPTDWSGADVPSSYLPSLHISYNSNKYARKDLERCSWMLFSDEAIRTSHASDCSDLADWKMYLTEFDQLSDSISAQGEFAKSCRYSRN